MLDDERCPPTIVKRRADSDDEFSPPSLAVDSSRREKSCGEETLASTADDESDG